MSPQRRPRALHRARPHGGTPARPARLRRDACAALPRDGRLRARGETAGTMIYKLSVMLAILNRGVTAEYKVKPRCPSSRTPPAPPVAAFGLTARRALVSIALASPGFHTHGRRL